MGGIPQLPECDQQDTALISELTDAALIPTDERQQDMVQRHCQTEAWLGMAGHQKMVQHRCQTEAVPGSSWKTARGDRGRNGGGGGGGSGQRRVQERAAAGSPRGRRPSG